MQASDREKREVLTIVAILSAINDVETTIGGPVPKGPIYLALDCDIDLYQRCERAMVRCGFATATSETLTLTEKGRDVVKRLSDAGA